ncbi:mannosyl-3-phosphoglycerate phosphatase [Sulfitobacter marinus]|uniref:Mannosyl-3-phosphoglycerate phosphatase n=1 Tax=Sulfitobacter marinus TaxID=394264 RepID=A0A1I6VCB7_9RHOB|nr:HAD-IIB family hydrolase [Sulfitobacter marinus]SFT11319.1 mannosyl-3-phosphoglycerate phosphatase [Sulfitobacter marinus]
MSPMFAIPILVFTDLDGTLIDHASYDASAAGPALDALRACGGGLIMASSKTGPEIARIRDALGWVGFPAIVENGAGLLSAGEMGQGDAAQYKALRGVLDKAPQDLRQGFCGFGDMSVAEVAAVTGLAQTDAALAKQRAFSEPGLWEGTDPQLKQFLSYLAGQRVTAREGGRFLTLSFGQTKADRMADLIAEFNPAHTVALGDAPNDVEMLQAADTGVIVANPHRVALPRLPGEETSRIIRTKLPGPQGWNAAILELLLELKLR